MVSLRRNKSEESNDTRVARDAGTTEVKPQLAEEGQDAIVVGNVYTEKNGTREVTPYFVDFGSAHVQFNDVGRGNEDRMRTSDFLNTFEDTGGNRSPTRSEEVKEKDA